MAIRPEISLNLDSVNVSPAINAFENAMLNAQTRGLRQQQSELGKIQLQQAQDNKRLSDDALVVQGVRPLLSQAMETGDPTAVKVYLTKTLTDIQARNAQGANIDPTRVKGALDAINEGKLEQVLTGGDNLVQMARDRGLLGGGQNQQANSQFGSQQTFKDSKGNLFFGTTKRNPNTGAVESVLAPVSGGNVQPEGQIELVSRLGETSAEKQESIVDTEAAKTTAKAIATRNQGYISSGIEAADSVNNIKRSLELLDSVETGGFDNLKLRASQLFGIEGADEGELSARLGISVLSQLKPIFGAAFTAAEGERLERISARFGANAGTNKRLLNDALTVAERAARRGLSAAEKSGDEFTANEIRTVLDSFQGLADEAPQSPSVSPASPTDGQQNTVIRFDAQGNMIQ